MKNPKISLCKRKLYEIYNQFGFYYKFYTFVRLFTAPLFEVEKYIPKEGNIVEIGCGTGIFSNLLCLMSEERAVIGFDISEKRIAVANITANNCQQLSFHAEDAKHLDIKGSSTVVLVDLIHHMPFREQKFLLEKIFKELETPGLLVLKDLEKRPFWKYIVHYVQDSISYRSKLYFRSRQEMVRLLCSIGYKVNLIRLLSWLPYPHILYVCEKQNSTNP